MISTELHNLLIEEEIKNKLLLSEKMNQKVKTAIVIEKMKSVLLWIGIVFIALLLAILLYRLFPSKAMNSTNATTQNKECEERIPSKLLLGQEHKNIEKKETKSNKKHKKDTASLMNGIDYVKNDQEHKNIEKKETKSNKKHKKNTASLMNGIDYVKHDNFIFKRTWKDGILVEEKKLYQTIEESRNKSKENIPQISTPRKIK